MKPWAQKFYLSEDWRRTRDAYLSSVGEVCERCARRGETIPAVIVHHRQRITRANIYDPTVTLCWDNLEALCMECHNKEHHGAIRHRRYVVDAAGNVLSPPPSDAERGRPNREGEIDFTPESAHEGW